MLVLIGRSQWPQIKRPRNSGVSRLGLAFRSPVLKLRVCRDAICRCTSSNVSWLTIESCLPGTSSRLKTAVGPWTNGKPAPNNPTITGSTAVSAPLRCRERCCSQPIDHLHRSVNELVSKIFNSGREARRINRFRTPVDETLMKTEHLSVFTGCEW